MRAVFASMALCLLVSIGACGITEGDSGDADPSVLALEIATWDLAGDALELDLKGPVAGTLLTVTYFGNDVWTIESFATDFAMFYRPDLDLICGYAPMPFKITYYGE